MLELYVVRLALAGESLGYMVAAWAWLRVWQQPDACRVSIAGGITALCCFIRIFRIAIVLVASTP